MKKLDYLENYDVVALDEKKTKEIDGGLGPWGWIIVGYVASEVLEGIQRGMQGECPCDSTNT